MNDETKDILFRDLAMRLPYGANMYMEKLDSREVETWELRPDTIEFFLYYAHKPILRPLSDLSDQQLILLGYQEAGIKTLIEDIQQGEICQREYMYLIENHYDVSLLIERGMAIDVNTLETDPYK